MHSSYPSVYGQCNGGSKETLGDLQLVRFRSRAWQAVNAETLTLRDDKRGVTFAGGHRTAKGGEGLMAREAIRRFGYVLVSAVIVLSAVLAGAANWPNH